MALKKTPQKILLHRGRHRVSGGDFVETKSGARKVFEIHHKVEISQGGAVYSVDNLLIVSPKYHISLGRIKF